jgi:hypothetical protein
MMNAMMPMNPPVVFSRNSFGAGTPMQRHADRPDTAIGP